MPENIGLSPEEMGLNAEPERNESREINFELYERSLSDGTADEYLEEVGALPAEALLEEQGDDRVWSELSDDERLKIEKMLADYATKKGYRIEKNEQGCMVMPE